MESYINTTVFLYVNHDLNEIPCTKNPEYCNTLGCRIAKYYSHIVAFWYRNTTSILIFIVETWLIWWIFLKEELVNYEKVKEKVREKVKIVFTATLTHT